MKVAWGESVRQVIANRGEDVGYACAYCRLEAGKQGVRRMVLLDEKALALLCKTDRASLK